MTIKHRGQSVKTAGYAHGRGIFHTFVFDSRLVRFLRNVVKYGPYPTCHPPHALNCYLAAAMLPIS